MTSGFDLGHDLDLEFSRSNIEFAISQPKMVRLPRNEKQTYWLNSRPQMWPMVWIYQIVTGVTSVVGVPSTHLVIYKSGCDSEFLDKLITCHKPQYMHLHSLHSDWAKKLSQQKIGPSASGSINYTVKRVSQQPVQFQKWRVLWTQMLFLGTLLDSLFDAVHVSLYVIIVGYLFWC